MVGWKTWRRRLLTWLGVAGLMILGTANLRAERLSSAEARKRSIAVEAQKDLPADAVPAGNVRTPKSADETGFLAVLRSEWEAIHEELLRCALESVTTMIIGHYWGSPPPPKDQGAPPPPPPPPPTGGGEDPPPNPPGDPPPNGTPEPASLVTALVGAGLATLYAWRKRRRR